ncbi:MAG TPA: neutral zinc metallopeptidase [Parvularculaceae bacterium]|nr:neutral zinc metallopeptidase [Amphiplicatus sp.]HOP18591.1 neutral zinc metallopeptidase [Amphiplicatus sp.]HPE29721.1 neutral zinc metallopeptidase [Parvularculaceae bacterium]HRX38494.1 neutral zinc metallopeptidase [Parvularculaceae bacterium]
MVKWRDREVSRNVEDRRGASSGGGLSGSVVPMILQLVLSKFGIGGVVALAAGFFALQAIGVNPLALLSEAPATSRTSAADDESYQFVGSILGETEDVWTNIFANSGGRYVEPTLVMFTGQVNSACGFASAAVGPFYCPADQKVYLDTSFFDELARRFGAPGDFAAAYVIAHEIGHHVQTLTGVSDQVRAAQSRGDEAESNAIQVRMELQADCYAGVWAHSAEKLHDFLDAGDIEEGLKAASAIGDDTLQRNAGRRVTPESFTHGTSEQRSRWFRRGFDSGDPADCDTFSANSL